MGNRTANSQTILVEHRAQRTATDWSRRPSLRPWRAALESGEPLTREQEVAVCARIQAGDEAARDELAEANVRFVVDVAAQYQNRGLEFGELISAGNLGLMTAVDRFDAAKGFKFITYAVWWIRQTILEALRTEVLTVRRPNSGWGNAAVVNRTSKALQQSLLREPTPDEIAEASGLTAMQVCAGRAAQASECSLDLLMDPGDYGSTPLVEALPDINAPDLDAQMDAAQVSQVVDAALRTLPIRTRYVLRRCFGFGPAGRRVAQQPMSVIGQRLGISRERVRQLRNEGLKALAPELRRRGVDASVLGVVEAAG